MSTISLSRVVDLPEGGLVRLIGALSLQIVTVDGRIGLRPIRLPKEAFVQFPFFERETVRTVVSGCSGVHIRVDTDAEALKLTVRCTRVDYGELPSAVNAFTACVNGEKVSEVTLEPDAIETISRDGRTCTRKQCNAASTVVLNNLGAGKKTVTIWLPQTMMVDLIGLIGTKGESVSPSAKTSAPQWLHYGSSISHCHSTADPLQVWPVAVAGMNGLEITNLGFAGQCMLDPFVARAIAASDADIITLSAGVNITGARTMNQRTFVPAMHGFLDIIREQHPKTPIVLVSSIYWPGSDNVPGPSDARFNDDGTITCYSYGDPKDIAYGALTLEQSRIELRELVEVRREAYGENLYYLDGLSLFGPDDVDHYRLPDGIHPDAELYAEIARRFSRQVFEPGGLIPLE